MLAGKPGADAFTLGNRANLIQLPIAVDLRKGL